MRVYFFIFIIKCIFAIETIAFCSFSKSFIDMQSPKWKDNFYQQVLSNISCHITNLYPKNPFNTDQDLNSLKRGENLKADQFRKLAFDFYNLLISVPKLLKEPLYFL